MVAGWGYSISKQSRGFSQRKRIILSSTTCEITQIHESVSKSIL